MAWDPWRRGKSKLAVSAGRYYDKIFLAVPLIEVEPQTTDLVFDADGSFPEVAGVFGEREGYFADATRRDDVRGARGDALFHGEVARGAARV